MPNVNVLDSTMHYQQTGPSPAATGGVPVVFLHGNPTSSYLWRKVLARMPAQVRCLAPDLIGMGASGRPPVAYRFADHARYLDAWFDALGLTGVVLVGHDWGGALAFDWAARHPEQVAGVAFLETIVKPMTWDEFPPAARELFRQLRTLQTGEALVLDQNLFLTQALPATVATGLSPQDLAAYRDPYPDPASRRPLLQWARSIPLDGEPADVVARVEAYDRWLARSPEVPKLLLTFDAGPSTMLGPDLVAWCREHMTGLEVVGCGPAGHHAPEDQPEPIAAAIADWLVRHHLAGAAPAEEVA